MCFGQLYCLLNKSNEGSIRRYGNFLQTRCRSFNFLWVCGGCNTEILDIHLYTLSNWVKALLEIPTFELVPVIATTIFLLIEKSFQDEELFNDLVGTQFDEFVLNTSCIL